MPINQISPENLRQRLLEDAPPLLLDVREPNEFGYARIDGSVNIPLNQLPMRRRELAKDRDVAVICHHGVRSQQGCEFLQHEGFDRLYNLQGGIDAWSRICDPAVPRY